MSPTKERPQPHRKCFFYYSNEPLSQEEQEQITVMLQQQFPDREHQQFVAFRICLYRANLKPLMGLLTELIQQAETQLPIRSNAWLMADNYSFVVLAYAIKPGQENAAEPARAEIQGLMEKQMALLWELVRRQQSATVN
jgi:hypothetical protein